MKTQNLTLIAVAAAMALGSSHALATSVVVDQSESGKHAFNLNGTAGAVSKYRGLDSDRIASKLNWNAPWNASGSGFLPQKYEILRVNPETLASYGPLSVNGFQGDLEKNVPFRNTSNKIVGLYVPEWAYWERGYTADLVPAKNVTHVFYSFLGICDFDDTTIHATSPEGNATATPNPDPNRVPGTGNATNNSGLALEGNTRGQLLLAAMCGRNGFPKYGGGLEPIMSGSDTPASLKRDFEVTKYDPVAGQKMLESMRQMKQANPNLNVMVSVGGWTLSSPFHGMVSQKEARTVFVNSVIRFLKAHSFVDGIDLDWEHPGGGGPDDTLGTAGNAAERASFTALVKELRAALDREFAGSQRKQLSAAVTASPAKLTAIDFTALKNDFDFINVMTYDLYGAFTRYPSHHASLHAKPVASPYGAPGTDQFMADKSGAPIVIGGKEVTQAEVLRTYSAEGAINYILDNTRFPAHKLVMGAASYSRGWHTVRVKEAHDKLFWHGVADGQSVSRQGLGVNGTFENSVTDFRELYDKHLKAGQNVYYDKQAEAAYIWIPKGSQNGFKLGSVESFDSQRSVIAKAEFARKKGLGGMFAWDASTDNGLIVNAMNAGMCNTLQKGAYYNFTENYAGVVTTEVIDSQNGVAAKVRESLSGAQPYHFNGQQFCAAGEGGGDGGQPPAPAPVADAGQDITVVATGNWGFAYKLDGSNSRGKELTYEWRVKSGPFSLRELGGKTPKPVVTAQKAEAVVPVNRVDETVYELTVTDKTGRTAKATKKVTAIAPKATIQGNSSTPSGTAASFSASSNFNGGTMSYDWTLRNAAGNQVDSGKGKTWSTKKDLTAGDYTVELAVHSTAGARKANSTHKLKVTGAQQPDQNDAFFDSLRLSHSANDYGDTMGFTIVALHDLAHPPSGKADYRWSLPDTAQDASTQGSQTVFNVKKAAQARTVTVAVDVRVKGRNKRLDVQLTVPAKTGSEGDNGGSTQYPGYKPNSGYKVGDIVRADDGKLYQCTVAGWCDQEAYQPTGHYGSSAWRQYENSSNNSGYPTYVAGNTYQTGDTVFSNGKLYECKVAGWCSQGGAYVPGLGHAWRDAWLEK